MMKIVQKVLDRLEGGNETKIEKFFKESKKAWEKQITIRKDKIEELTSKKEELMEELLTEKVLDVDISRLKGVDERKGYIVDYQEMLLNAKVEIEGIEAEIETKEAEIERYNWLISLLN